jgi:hypothetical protein
MVLDAVVTAPLDMEVMHGCKMVLDAVVTAPLDMAGMHGCKTAQVYTNAWMHARTLRVVHVEEPVLVRCREDEPATLFEASCVRRSARALPDALVLKAEVGVVCIEPIATEVPADVVRLGFLTSVGLGSVICAFLTKHERQHRLEACAQTHRRGCNRTLE